MAKKATAKKSATKKTTAAKKATAKKTAAVKSAAVGKASPRKTASRKAAPRKVPAKKGNPLTTIVANVDVGFGNTLFIRGSGAGLSWDHGVPMENIADDAWSWSCSTGDSEIEVKFLIEDSVWSNGENYVVLSGGKSVLEPSF